jgi:hypothetical protein
MTTRGSPAAAIAVETIDRDLFSPFPINISTMRNLQDKDDKSIILYHVKDSVIAELGFDTDPSDQSISHNRLVEVRFEARRSLSRSFVEVPGSDLQMPWRLAARERSDTRDQSPSITIPIMRLLGALACDRKQMTTARVSWAAGRGHPGPGCRVLCSRRQGHSEIRRKNTSSHEVRTELTCHFAVREAAHACPLRCFEDQGQGLL